ncbi:hypothetical protein INT45_000219 [Circinella minor]|uniref:F-box domain-containing protein n=1 Tax=Circinella minor TaxID=1195481 RepID=A0A8H7S231_9FUNG|nr:hypothetical protein INT45_000219 [Circinella minor]
MSIIPSPISTTLDTTLVQDLFDKASNALNKRNYEETIDLTSEAVKRIHQLQLLAVLDHRSWAYGMKYKFNNAIKDAERMIACGPECPAGYLRLGSLLDNQGKSAAAAEIYQEGLNRVSKDDPTYLCLVEYYQKSKEKSEKCVDFITMLPSQICEYIISFMSLSDKINWLGVSQAWSKKIMNDKMTWAHVSGGDDMIVARALSRIGHNIEELEMTNTFTDVWLEYLEHMKNGYFKQIKTMILVDKVIAPYPVLNAVKDTMERAFWEIRHTLTKLDFTFVKCDFPLIYLADILMNCTSLKTFIFDAMDDLQLFVGDFDRLETPHNSLIDIDITSTSITGEAIQPLLIQCPKLRRLLVKNCTPNVVDMVHDHCPNLEIFGYETHSSYVPPLKEELWQEEKRGEDNSGSCLREIYSRDGGYGVPAEAFMRLLRKNAKTLEVVFANFSITEEQENNDEPHQDSQAPDYGEKFEFERLEKLTYWSDIYGCVEPLLLHAIKACPSLKMFNPAGSTNIPKIIDILVTRLPAVVEQLEFANVDSEDDDSGKEVVRLLKAYYDNVSAADQKLRKVRFHYSNVVTDDVLDILSGFKTLETTQLLGLTKVTTNGITNFLQKIVNNAHITELRLDDIYVVDDTVLQLLSKMEYLESLHLEDLSRITDKGIRYLVDNVKGLRKVKIKNCKRISDNEEFRTYVKDNTKVKEIEMIFDF